MSTPRHAPRVPFALLVTGLVVGGLVLLLALNTASAANELQRHDLATKDQNIANQVQELRNEVAASAAPGNLARAAAELGMVPAGNPAFIVLGPGGTATVLGKPRAVTGVPLPVAPTAAAAATPTAKASATSTSAARPSPTPSGKSSSAASAKPSARSTAKSSATPSATPSGKPSRATSPAPAPAPTPTPTPTLTLPGGNR